MSEFLIITSPIWGTILIALGMREITSSKYDKQWSDFLAAFNNWWFK